MEASNISRMISLNGNNWMIWKPRMEDLLYCKDLYGPLQGDSAKPTTMTDDEWKRLDRKTIGFIRQWLDYSVFHYVSTEFLHILFGKSWKVSMKEKQLATKLF